MTDIVLPTKALAVNPLKASQPIGASLAFLGLARTVPLEHGARGCTSFNKLFFMRHFREPIALQTTAMDQVTTVLGADDNVVEALSTVCVKDCPDIIGLITTGLAETQGADIPRTIHMFRRRFPAYAGITVIPVRATDTLGCLETGFALAVEAIIDALVTPSGKRRPGQVNVLASAMLTPGDVDTVRRWIEAFGLSPVILPDLADSLDGHLIESGYSTLTYGGTPREAVASMGASEATLVVGPSLERAADLLKERTGIPDHRFAGLIGLDECDAFTGALASLSGRPAPARLERRRDQLLDAMVDCQFQLGGARIAIAADADLLGDLTRFAVSMGADVVAAISSARAAHLASLPVNEVIVGDLEDLEWLAHERDAELIVANSHGIEVAKRTGTALLRAGFPIYDRYGAHLETWIGYTGTRRCLFETANLLAGHYREIKPYRSRYRQGTAQTTRRTAP